jgi:hypothetical protein
VLPARKNHECDSCTKSLTVLAYSHKKRCVTGAGASSRERQLFKLLSLGKTDNNTSLLHSEGNHLSINSY